MTCDPSEHDFVNESSYSIELETDSAVVETLEEEKKCRHCGKTPDELDDFVTGTDDSSDDSSEHSGDVETESVEPDDDAVIMTSDNSERQSSQSPTGADQQQNRTPPSEESVDDISEGDQTDDAYIIGGSAVEDESESSETAEVDDGLEDQWGGSDGVYTGPLLVCPNCGFEVPQTSAPQYPGDSCPECRKAYLEKE